MTTMTDQDCLIIHQDDLVPVVIADPAPILVRAGTADPVAVVAIAGPPGPPGPGSNPATVVIDDTDGVTATFPLPHPARDPAQIQVFRNGLREIFGVGFTATASSITVSSPPLVSDTLVAVYERNS